ncbi:MAG: hypothetical protein HWE30_12065 [Methylocystaceae bacterium]|nr:hypothetical protein [Methylocystaceae bacterium]
MPFQLLLPWLVMLPMIYGSTLIGVPMFLAIFIAALGLSAMHFYDMCCTKSDEEDAV